MLSGQNDKLGKGFNCEPTVPCQEDIKLERTKRLSVTSPSISLMGMSISSICETPSYTRWI